MNKAFTLIELLVVVMIIGILSAVALPQYTKAVNKSRYAGLMPLAKSVKQAEEAVYMANAAYTNNLSDLAITLPGEINNGGDIGVTVGSDGSKSYVRAVNTKIGNAYVMYFDKSGTYPKEIHCEAKSGDNRAKELCLNMGAVSENTATSTTSGYDAYVLEGEVPSGGGGSNTQIQEMGSVKTVVDNWTDGMDGEAMCTAAFGSLCAGSEYTNGQGISYSFSDDSGFAVVTIEHPAFPYELILDSYGDVVVAAHDLDYDSAFAFCVAIGLSEEEAASLAS